MNRVETPTPDVRRELRREWDDAAPGWDRWREILEGSEAGPVQTAKLIELTAIGPGDAVLDLATGYGEPGLTIARAVQPGGSVTCTDISAGMLAIARRRASAQGDLDNVSFVESAIEDLDFPTESFDAIVSRHGLQFVEDVPATLRALRSFLARDGHLAAIVWGPPDKVQFSRAVRVIMEELELPPPPSDRPGIFALADAGRLASMMEDAGLSEVATGTLKVVYETARPEDFTQLVRDISPPITALVDDAPASAAERVWEKVTDAWRPLSGPTGATRVECEAIWVAGANRSKIGP